MVIRATELQSWWGSGGQTSPKPSKTVWKRWAPDTGVHSQAPGPLLAPRAGGSGSLRL